MRVLTIAGAAALLTLSAAAPAAACSGPSMHSTQAATADYSAAKTKKKPVKKVAKKKAPKVEYMRAAPMK